MLSHQSGFSLGSAGFIRENRCSAPRAVSAVTLTEWLWGDPPTQVYEV
jgi:hypothetical protein